MEPIALSVSQAARILGVGRSTLYAHIKAGTLPIKKCGRRTLILRTDIEAFLKALPVRDSG